MKTFRIHIEGVVQGVGFRPYVYTLAKNYGLRGTVSNNENGVVIIVSGSRDKIQSFFQKLIQNPPPVSKIKHSEIKEISFQNYKDFKIIPSSKKGKLNLTLTPDFAICEDCKNEIRDPQNRRSNYPFTTCVNCGPRWAITRTFPFERDHTSIREYEMCDTCKNEYTNPENRRFHSQTNSCTICGIRISLSDAEGFDIDVSEKDIFKKTASLITEGKIIAIKNTGGYLLCCDATNRNAVHKLRKKKKRPHKPFAVLYPSLSLLESHLPLNEQQKNALTSTERPIVILQKRGFMGSLAFEEVIPGLNQLGVMLPYTGILQLLADELENPLVATSGNFHGSPIISDQKQAVKVLSEIADYFLHHDLEITNPQDDSVIKFSPGFNQEVLFRRSRGFAPNYFNFSCDKKEKIMAMGAHLKSTIAFLPNDNLYLSQYLGNLDNFDVYERFVRTTDYFTELFEEIPDTILVDNHPAYQSTLFGVEYSQKKDIPLFKIQHHKAHFASVLGEHELFGSNENILGVVWDGTGYGEDQNIWGGEFFNYRDNKMERLTHFQYFDWLAGDKMAKEPRISLFSLIGEEFEVREKFTPEEQIIYQSIKDQNKLKTSSVGRLFDAVASLLDICDYNTYEGEAAILMENKVTTYNNINNCTSYCTTCESENIETRALVKNIYYDLQRGTPKEQIILNFIFTLATIILQVARKNQIKKIALSGGVFQNTVLIDILKELSRNNFELFFNKNLSPNDENVSFGQLMYYLNCETE